MSITDYNDSVENILHTVGKPVENVEIKIVDRETGIDCLVVEVVCACIKLKAGVQFDENFLRESLALHPAKYKIPAYFMVCKSFPLLGSGKVNGAALKQLATEKFSRR